MPTPTRTAAIAETLHSARFAPYRAYCAGNDQEALKLYRWNLELSAAFHEVLSVTEVALRNAIDCQLRIWNPAQGQGFTTDWAVDGMAAPLGSLVGQKRLEVAEEQAARAQNRRLKEQDHRRHKIAVDHNDLLTQFTFGLWRDLLPNGKTQARRVLWNEALVHAFPHENDPTGSLTFQRVSRLHALRNRVGHMEHLLYSKPGKKHRDALLLVRSICPSTMEWLSGVSRVPILLKNCPVESISL
ncbi:hypothetical protein [Rhodococcus sp. ARC_M6]|uniref:hypothetical protein n=1 Tax=Rhodococcus sp. ARC_M6 TaxID=2928852 RepID=UPI001FB43C02|nr:hypothetical protein [Rhodococcus sp. ARC_M6]MCJ0907424.1 hypothetical protein [Rhodococcus sp. ARC_M6]